MEIAIGKPNQSKIKRAIRCIALLSSLLCLQNTAKAQDVGISSLDIPYDSICSGISWPVVVTLNNYSQSPIDLSIQDVTIVVNVTGASSQTFTYVMNSGILSPYSTQQITVTSTADMSAPGIHIFDAVATVAGDFDPSNDAMQSRPVVVKQTPDVIGEPNPIVCAGTVMPAYTFYGVEPGATFTWTNDNPSIGLASSGTGDRPAFIPVNNGTTTAFANISVQAEYNGCISGSFGYMIQVEPLPTVSAGGDVTSCTGSAITFNATANGALAFTWNFGDGGTSATFNPSYIYSIPGVYTADVTAVSPSGCMSGDTVIVTIAAGPTLTTSVTDPSCEGLCNGSAAVSAVGGTPTYSYLWNSSPMQTTAVASSLCSGPYTVTVNDANGCSSIATVVITDPTPISISATSTDATCSGLCNGSASVTVSGGTGTYTYLWSPGGYTLQNFTSLCSGTYTVTATDGNGCVSQASTVFVSAPAPLSAGTSPDDTICNGQSVQIYVAGAGGTPPYSFVWNDGSSNFSTANLEVVSPSTSTNYVVTVTDANNCTNTGISSVFVRPNSSVYGHVTHSGGVLSTGVNNAVLFSYLPFNTSFDTVQVSPVNTSGDFIFSNITSGNYLVKVFNDTSAYPLIIPTYYNNAVLWNSAMIVANSCTSNDTISFSMVEVPAISGPGSLSGTIVEGLGFSRAPGEPIPGIDIKLGRNPGGQLVASTQTNSSGQYTFSNLPLNNAGESYTLYVDIPGLDRDSTYTVVLNGTQNTFAGLDYVADSASVTPTSTVGIHDINVGQAKFTLYPNPTKDLVYVDYTLSSESRVSLDIYNVLGIKSMSLLSEKQTAGNYRIPMNSINNLKPGVYFVTLNFNGKIETQRLVISK
ncbi:MAG: hypothetical protein K0Q95_1994 [Bacteroidota bacterium]|jgi:hypothetical protein|nr:hypothetical protein [Bacteroidota bacterium]